MSQAKPKRDPSVVVIDVTDETIKWRYTCPRGHRQFEPTNGGIWCRSCEHDDAIDDAHYHAIRDQKDGTTIDFDRVELVNGQE